MPAHRIVQGLSDQAFRQFADNPDFFGDGDEDIRADHPEFFRLPPRQHFETDNIAGSKVDLFLVVGNKFTLADAAPYAIFQIAAEADIRLHAGFKPRGAIPSAMLGMIHGDIGMVQQGAGIL